jgi:hypothetical protein
MPKFLSKQNGGEDSQYAGDIVEPDHVYSLAKQYGPLFRASFS